MSKGTLVLIPFPFTDLSGQKVRPALVLYVSARGEDCIVVFLSSQKEKKVGTFDITAPASRENGLKADSVIKLEKVATLQKKLILGELGQLERQLLLAVDRKFKTLFHL